MSASRAQAIARATCERQPYASSNSKKAVYDCFYFMCLFIKSDHNLSNCGHIGVIDIFII